ncbi:MAG TPA: dTMP kinase [Nitrospiria bacterium]|nr:dTMP kinase [Nitrospiria bacterium]
MRGLFITFEGPEGGGKTTQIKRLAAALRRKGYRPKITREPGGTRLGEQIRRLLLRQHKKGLDPRTELFLYLGSRSQHISEVILPALKAGRIVLCDRFSDSTLVYQGSGRRLNMTFVGSAVAFASKPLKPDVTFLLDLNIKKGLARVRKRGQANRFDRESLEFHQRIRRGFLSLARREPRRIYRIDAEQESGTVQAQIWEIISRKLARRGK